MTLILKTTSCAALAAVLLASCAKPDFGVRIPDGAVKETFVYGIKGSDTLSFDLYRDTSWTSPHPTVLFSFGGGWRTGSRESAIWAGRFVKEGYAVVSIDYRKTITDASTLRDSVNFASYYDKALKLAIEDLFDATSYIVENSEALFVDPTRIVAMGSSAGAINSVTGEWLICNRDPLAVEHLPSGFNYAGVVSLAGAVWKYGEDRPVYDSKPCPHLFIHGISDNVVNYNVMAYPQCNYYGFGPGSLAEYYKSNGWPYYLFAVEDADHYMCFGPDVSIMLPSEKVDYMRVVFDYLERLVHEGMPFSVEYREKDLDGARTWDRLKKSRVRIVFSSKLRKQVCALPEYGTGTVEIKTYDYAVKDGDTLRLDVIRDPSFKGRRPVLLYSPGGGWESGSRNFIESKVYPLADEFAKAGFVVVSHDYRLYYRTARKTGLVPDESIVTHLMLNEGEPDSVAVDAMLKAVEIAVEDMYDATSFIVSHADEWNIDPDRIVTMGGSAGGFNCLHAEYWLCNGMPVAKEHLPDGFRYAGLIPCAGAIFHKADEPLIWKKMPAPILFYHGDEDPVVAYDRHEFENLGVVGSGPADIVPSLEEIGAPYMFYTIKGRSHDVASFVSGYMDQFTMSFIDRLVINGEKIQAAVMETWDPAVDNPSMLYLQRAQKYPFNEIFEDYFKYIAHAWD